MADKLSESTWTSFTKDLAKKNPKLDLSDKALVSALKEFDKTDESKPEPRLKALEVLIKQIPEQVKTLVKGKKELGDKPFGEAKDKLYALLQEAENLHKSAVAKAAEAKAAQAKGKGKDDEEEEETPALLTSKMIPLLRELKKGEVSMPSLIALAGKETVVLVSRRAISPARGKLLKEQMAQPSGLKFIRGECLYEKNALTFVVQSPGAALAKRLRQALLDQTAMRWKVRVRGEDGVEEEDGAEDDEPRKPASAEQLAYTQRLLKVRDRYQKALREQHPKAVQFKELMDQANAKANEQHDYAGASQVLQVLDKALDEPERAQEGGVDAQAAFNARLKALTDKIKEAQTAGHPGAKEANLVASEAGMYSRKGDLVRAEALLKQAEALMSGAKTAPPSGTSTAAADGDEPMARGTAKAPPMDPAFAFRSRLTGLVPRLRAVEAAGASAVGQINAKRDAAIALAKQKGFPQEKEAMALLDEIEALIAASGVDVNAGSVPRTAAATGTKVIFQQTRLAWDATRSKLKAEVKKLEDDIRAQCKDDKEVGIEGVDLSPLSVVLERLDSRLMDKLDEALNAEDPAGRQKAHSEAKTIVAEYMAFVNSNELMADIDDSGFVPVTVRETALSALTLLASKL